MTVNKNLYFIPILARAIESKDQKRGMVAAFDEIAKLGNQAVYKKGFRQFHAFIKAAIDPSGKKPDEKIELIQEAVYRIIYDLVTDTFEGNERQKQAFIDALKSNFRWDAEFERIRSEAQSFLLAGSAIGVEILKDVQVISSCALSTDPMSTSSIYPGKYAVRLSNGRVLWEGDLTREDVIWAYAYPEQDWPMAAETEDLDHEPTKTIPLLDGELSMHVFAGIESGRITLKIEKRT